MTITFFGHSALQIETGGTTLLVDPFFSGNPSAEGVVTADDVDPDVLLLTHAHGDHYGDAEAIVTRVSPLVVAPYEVVQYLGGKTGHEDAFGMNVGGAHAFDWGRLTMTYARHSSSFPDGTYGGPATGFVLEAGGTTIYHTGDTCRFAEMAWIGQQHDVDLLLLPIGDVFTMGPREALDVVRDIRPKAVLPLHYDTWPPIEVDTDAFAEGVRALGAQPHVLAPGESVTI